MDSLRRSALAAGVLYLLTFVSIPTLALYGPVHDRNYVLGLGPDTAVLVGGILEIIVALAGIGTAVALYPVLRRQNEGSRWVRRLAGRGSRRHPRRCRLSAVDRELAAGRNGDRAVVAGQTLAILYDRIFLLSQSLMPVVNDVLLGFLLYRSRLVPRVLPVLAFVGALLLVASDIGVLFNLWEQRSALTAFAALPVALFEFSLGVWLVVKGFRPSPITAGIAAAGGASVRRQVAG